MALLELASDLDPSVSNHSAPLARLALLDLIGSEVSKRAARLLRTIPVGLWRSAQRFGEQQPTAVLVSLFFLEKDRRKTDKPQKCRLTAGR